MNDGVVFILSILALGGIWHIFSKASNHVKEISLKNGHDHQTSKDRGHQYVIIAVLSLGGLGLGLAAIAHGSTLKGFGIMAVTFVVMIMFFNAIFAKPKDKK